MNEKFYALPAEKQQKIINAGYRVFSQNTYKKSPMSEIAAEAGISKSLLFHYFYNKRGLYLFLWENCVEATIKYMTAWNCYEQTDLFEMLYRGMQAKIRMIYDYPYMAAFSIKAFYERDPQVCSDVHLSYNRFKAYRADEALASLNPEQFVEGIDLSMMYREMYLASEGYLWEMLQQEPMDVEKMERDFTEMIAFWKKVYFRKKEEEAGG